MKENGYKSAGYIIKVLVGILGVILVMSVVTAIILKSIGGDSVWEINNGEEDTTVSSEASASDNTAPVEDGLVRVADELEIGNMDVARNTDTYYLALNVFDRLVEIRQNDDGTNDIEPSLATEWSPSGDGRTYTFTLRDDVVFSDGEKLTADDVRFSLTRLLTVPESEQVYYADMILGADEVLSGEAKELEGIKVIDDTHLSITLKEPFPSFISMLGSPACSILSKKKTEEAGEDYGKDPEYIIGSGPYMIADMNDSVCTLELNPLYWGKEPSVKKAERYVMTSAMMDENFRKGKLDMLDLDQMNSDAAEYYLENEEYDGHRTKKENVQIFSLMLNTAIPPLDNVKVRKAVQLAIDRQRIIDEVRGGYAHATDGIYPKGLIGYSEENQGWLKYDPAEAARLIKEAGLKENDTVELVISSVADMDNQKIISIIQENLNAVGLNTVTIIYDPESRLYLRRNGQVMAYTFDWIADYNDPDNFIYTIFGTEDSVKRYSSNYSDRQAMERIAGARNIEDDEKRLAEYRSLEKKLVQNDAVWVPLYSAEHIYMMGERLESYIPYWAGWSDVVLKDMVLK